MMHPRVAFYYDLVHVGHHLLWYFFFFFQHFLKTYLFNLFIFGCVGLLFVAVRGLLIAVASLVAEHGL